MLVKTLSRRASPGVHPQPTPLAGRPALHLQPPMDVIMKLSARTPLVLILAILAATVFARPAAAAQSIRGADPSVIRVGGTYNSAQSYGNRIAVRQASSTAGLAGAAARDVWYDGGNLVEVWAPEMTTEGGRSYIHFAAGRGAAHRMYVISSRTADSGYTGATQVALPDNKFAIDGTMFT